MRITRYPSINEQQFLGCVSAFVDSLSGELNTAMIALRRLQDKTKGAAFVYEMTLDTHRYGALIVIDRWATLAGTFGPHLRLSQGHSMLENARQRAAAAEEILTQANQLIDGSDLYAALMVEGCALAYQTVEAVFAEERNAAAQSAKLGPMLPAEFSEARQIFLQDLAVR